jgi:hypothetical protein
MSSKCTECSSIQEGLSVCDYDDHYDELLCDDCSKECDNCHGIFCSAYNRKLGMEVCDDCMIYNG